MSGVPASVLEGRYNNNTRNFTGDKEVRILETRNARKANYKFEMTGHILSPQQF